MSFRRLLLLEHCTAKGVDCFLEEAIDDLPEEMLIAVKSKVRRAIRRAISDFIKLQEMELRAHIRLDPIPSQPKSPTGGFLC